MIYILIFILLAVAAPVNSSQCILLPLVEIKDDIAGLNYGAQIPAEILVQSFTVGQTIDGNAKQVLSCFSDNVVIPNRYPIIPSQAAKKIMTGIDPKLDTDVIDKVPIPPVKPKPPVPTKSSWWRNLFIVAVAWAASATDSFTRGDSTDIGTNWDNAYTGWGSCELVTNEITITAPSSVCVETYNALVPGGNQYAQILISQMTVTTGQVGASVRTSTTPADQMYLCRVHQSDGTRTSRIQRRNSGSNATLIEENATSWAVGDTVKCEAVGTTISLYRNGTLVVTWTDATFSAGRGGIYVSSGSLGIALDNFEVGDVGGAAAVVRHRPIIQ